MTEAVRLAGLLTHAQLIITGRGEKRWLDYAKQENIETGRLVYEPRSRNTFENAQFAKAVLRPRSADRLILVTSASHMPRAVGAFRQAGFNVIPWPVKNAKPDRASSNAVAKHEWLGLVAYWLLGRTDALFPGPDNTTTEPSRHADVDATNSLSWLSRKAL